jgi:hypothetical protein
MFVWNVGLYARVQAVLCLRRLVAGLSPRRPGSDNMRFVVGNVAVGQIFLQFLFPLSVIAQGLCTIIQGVQKVTQPMAYLEYVFPGRLILKGLWPPRSPDLSPLPRLLFMGASQGYCVFKSSTHTARASDQHSAHCGQDINWHIAKRVR